MNLSETIDTLKAAAEPTRFRLLSLCARSQMSVTELVDVLGQSQPRVSRHLKRLCDAGLIERRRDGKHVFYHVPNRGDASQLARRLLSFVTVSDAQLEQDLNVAASRIPATTPTHIKSERLFNRAILDIAATGAIGAVLDIGTGSARIMKLLASYATRLVGVDNDRTARQQARLALQTAGLNNCSVLQGNMYQLPFDHGEFDTVIMDEILGDSDEPIFALTEAARTLADSGRLVILEQHQDPDKLHDVEIRLAKWLERCDLTSQVRRQIHGQDQHWLMVIASRSTPHQSARNTV
ncbi:MAG: metalloregulator ArsR/SmtB family transcription factor [Gammaproteobacteria bacterium]|nr:metalloregulator ArsR/SmtB family transcription factor [Gammaproteobacteria bacterium]